MTSRFATRCAGMACLLAGLTFTAASDDFPLKRMQLFTYVVDYEAAWSHDGRQIVLISSRHGGMKVHTMDAVSESHGSWVGSGSAGSSFAFSRRPASSERV